MEDDYSIYGGFVRRLIKPGTWHIQSCSGDGAYTYLLVGNNTALVIDPGQYGKPIRQYIERIIDLPILVCNTNGHRMHAGANGQFHDCPIYMSLQAARECRREESLLHLEEYSYFYNPMIIQEGYTLDLGNHKLEAIEMGCNSRGSMGYIDHKDKILFTGDEIESRFVFVHDLINGKYGCVQRYLSNLQKLKKRSNEFDTICPSHNGSPMDASMIDIYIENCERILNGIEGKSITEFPNYVRLENQNEVKISKEKYRKDCYRISEWKSTSIIYDADRLYLEDEEEIIYENQ